MGEEEEAIHGSDGAFTGASREVEEGATEDAHSCSFGRGAKTVFTVPSRAVVKCLLLRFAAPPDDSTALTPD